MKKQYLQETIHHSEVKWVDKLHTAITWEDVWNAVHNFLNTNQTKTIIWEQIHLQNYTQYSYNKWFKKNEKCFLCNTIPVNIFHVILHCHFTIKIWNEIEPILKELHPNSVTDEEKAFGIIERKQTPGIMLRNWLTYLKRMYSQGRKNSLSFGKKSKFWKIQTKIQQHS